MPHSISMTQARDLYRAGNDTGLGFAPDGETVDEAVAAYIAAGGTLILERRASDDVAVVSPMWSDHEYLAIGGDALGRNAWAVELKMPTARRVSLGSATWHIPPACQGQIVEVAYSTDDDGCPIRRATDRSDGSTSYQIGTETAREDYEPWNEEPNGYEWETAEASS